VSVVLTSDCCFVLLTIWHSPAHEEAISFETNVAFFQLLSPSTLYIIAREAIRMPVLVERLYIFLSTSDGLLTFTALDREQIIETFSTVGSAVVDEETVATKRTVAEGANEVVRVPTLAKSIYTIPDNSIVTVGTLWSVELIVTLLTEELVVFFDERLIL